MDDEAKERRRQHLEWVNHAEREYMEKEDPADHPLDSFGWCSKHGPSCPFSRREHHG